jgi:hypothetical protein
MGMEKRVKTDDTDWQLADDEALLASAVEAAAWIEMIASVPAGKSYNRSERTLIFMKPLPRTVRNAPATVRFLGLPGWK